MLKKFEDFIKEKKSHKDKVDIETSIKYARIPKDLKEDSLNYLKQYSICKKGKITGLNLHPDLIKKINDKNLPNGFDMGIDKDGYYIHTHRARSKSKETVNKITEKEIKFINSTG